jgi:acetate kinase
VRSLACQGLGFIGIRIDEERNRCVSFDADVVDIAAADAPVRVLVIRTDEERMIARETVRALERRHVGQIIRSQDPIPIPIEVSPHNVHLTQQHLEALFGPGHRLTPDRELSQPGHYASTATVNLIGPKGRLDGVRVFGPTSQATQVEIAMTEQFILGIHPPIRAAGDIANSPGITIEGPAGTLTIEEGVTCAMRHIHMTPEEALRFGLHDRDMVQVREEGDRELTFGDVMVRVHPDYRLSMHIDTDEASAGNIRTGAHGYIEGIQKRD